MKNQTLQAYSDTSNTKGDRNLHFKATRAVCVKRAAEIMRLATPGGYNEFNADLIDQIGAVAPKIRVILAREYSVGLYLKGSAADLKKVQELDLHADDCDIQPDGTLRLWWD